MKHLRRYKYHTLLILGFIFTVGLFISSPMAYASPTTYYISTTGNDTTGNGSIGNPWQTLFKACETVTTSGDIIHVNAGTYTETVQCVLAVGVSIEGDGITSILKSTLTADWTPMIAANSAEGTNGNQHISNVKLDGQSLSTFWAIHITGRSNFSVHDTTIVDFKDRGILFGGRNDSDEAAPSIYATGNSYYNNICSNSAAYNTANGIYGRGCLNIGGQDGMLIYNNTINQNQRPEGYNGWPIKYWNDGYLKGVKIYDNVLNKIPYTGSYPGENGWDFAIELFHIQGLEVYRNTITGGGVDLNYNSKGSYAFSLWIYDNIIKLDSLVSSNNIAITLEFDTDGAIIENNTVDKMSNGIAFTPRAGNTLSDITIRNNLFTNVNKNTGYGSNGSWINTHGGNSNYNINSFNVYNNTFLSDPNNRPWWGIEFGTVNTGTLQNINIKNNILSGVYSGAVVQGGTVVINNVNINNNDIYDVSNTTDPVWEDNTPTNYSYISNVHTDPLFVGGTDYTLQVSSTLIDAGVDVGIAYSGSAPDIGYAEYSSGINSSPSANAGPDQSITLPTSSILMASSASDSDGTIASHVWTKFSGPATYTITDANSYTTTITGLVEGTYIFRLTTTDDDAATGTDDIQVTVNPAGGGGGSSIGIQGTNVCSVNTIGVYPNCISTQQTLSPLPPVVLSNNPIYFIKPLKINIRFAKSLSSALVVTLPQRTQVEILEGSKSTEWVKIETQDGKVGYVRSKYTEVLITPGIQASTSERQLNVRKLESLKSPSIKVLKHSDIVDVLSVSSDTIWAKIKVINGLTGFVNKFYMRVLQ